MAVAVWTLLAGASRRQPAAHARRQSRHLDQRLEPAEAGAARTDAGAIATPAGEKSPAARLAFGTISRIAA